MRTIKVFDAKNYAQNWRVFKRDSVRAIIFHKGKLLLVRSEKYGDCKFPGGGIEAEEG
ncbi:MAG: hypothetical protein FWC16_11750 [Defluviitaleaceae bacterium]|nr:hypothetical protein [Defluviitaleaceae bacterium]MCL2275592.1 hypothetical protein [Defluviitaleaceae bacterium]